MASSCQGCGQQFDDDLPEREQCEDCPPRKCGTCGEMDSIASNCGCWVSLEGVPLADIKAVFARDGGFQLDHKVGVSDGE